MFYRHGENTRGGGKSSEYRLWDAIKQRCGNPNQKAFASYGGLGIHLHQPWCDDFITFRDDLITLIGRRPSPVHTLDRIDNDGHYEPGNIRWATRREQQLNRRTNHLLTHNGETLPLGAWAQRAGLPYQALMKRIRSGWSLERALDPARSNGGHPRRIVTYKGVTLPFNELAARYGLHRLTVYKRLTRGWTMEEALDPRSYRHGG